MDSTLISGAVTDQTGSFVLKNLPYGNYYLEAAFIGYNRKRVPIVLSQKNSMINLGRINLYADVTQIAEVTVMADGKQIDYQIDKKVILVSQDIAAAGGSLVNVLENTPSVQVDVEGNVTLRGSGNFQLLIDGKPGAIQGSDGLQQIPASAVQSVEIITSPSARYDPDGDAGIINVIMKKQKKPGVGGVVNVSLGSRNKYSADFLLNIRRKSFNIYTGMEYGNNQFHNTGKGERITFGDTSTYIANRLNGRFSRKSLNVKAGIDWYAGEKTTLSLSGNVTNRNFTRDFVSRNHWFTLPVSRDSFYLDESEDLDKRLFYNINLDLVRKFDDKGHMLQASAYLVFGKESERELNTVSSTDALYRTTGLGGEQSRTSTEQPEEELRLELNYTKPLGQNKIEVGLQSRWDHDIADYTFEDFTDGGTWMVNDSISNHFKYLDAMQSAYASFKGSLAGFEYQAGLRAEYDHRTLDQVTLNEAYTYEKLHFFPSMFLTRKLGEHHQLQLNYSRRIQRPEEHDLNPCKEFRGSSNVFYGNPSLRPEFTNAFEFNYQYSFQGGFLSFETYYRTTNNKISRITGQDTLNDRPVYTFTFINANNDNSLGIEAMGNLEVTKWWQLNLTGNIFRYELSGETEGEKVHSVSTSWRTNLNNFIMLGKNTRFQITCVYNGPTKTLQGQGEGFFMTNLALRRELLKKQIMVSFNVRDVFSTAAFAFTSEGSTFYTYNKFKRESPVFMINLMYRINNFRQAPRKSNGEQGEDAGGMDIGM
jgi:outer membrane receptor protein involved in Fe transport